MSDGFGKKFGELVRRKRDLKSMSQEELAAKATGGNKSRISNIENGKVAKPHPSTVKSLVDVLGITEDELGTCYGLDLAESLPMGLLQDIATRFGADNPDAPEAELVAYLKATAKEFTGLKARMDALAAADANLANLLGAAQGLLVAGDFAAADDLLADAEELQVAERALKEAKKAAEIAKMRADAALTNGDVVMAGKHITRAAGFIAGFDADAAAVMRGMFAKRLSERGLRFAGADLAEAIKLHQLNLGHWTKTSDPENWAATQNNLGNALRNQALRVSGQQSATLLARAVATYELALNVYTFDDAPQNWAATQNNLGIALNDQALRVSGQQSATLLACAIAAYDLALKVRTFENAPQDWAATQNNLGTALRDQALRVLGQQSASLLTRAVATYDLVLRVYTFEDTPQDWAMTQNNLGVALSGQAERVSGQQSATLLARAVAAYKMALKVYTFENAPQDWGMIKENLGRLFARPGAPQEDLQKALGYFDQALEVYDLEHSPYQYNQCMEVRAIITARLTAKT